MSPQTCSIVLIGRLVRRKYTANLATSMGSFDRPFGAQIQETLQVKWRSVGLVLAETYIERTGPGFQPKQIQSAINAVAYIFRSVLFGPECVESETGLILVV